MMEIDDDLDALYRAARAQEAPTGADRLAVRAAVLSALATTALSTTTSAAATQATLASAAGGNVVKAFTLGKLAVWLGAGVAIGSAVSSAAWVLSPAPAVVQSAPIAARAKPSSVRTSGHRASPAPRSVDVAAEPAAPVDNVVTAEPADPVDGARAGNKRAVPGREAPRAVHEVAPSQPPSSLLAESEALLSIQRALASGDATRALTLSSEQDAQFRNGALSEERAVLRVLAFCAAGEPEQARLARARFSVDYPRSPHTKRLQNSCAK